MFQRDIGRYLIIRQRALNSDNWTYGDWRQYVAFLDNGEAYCVRMSRLPLVLAMIGFLLLCLVAMGVAAAWTVQGVDWNRVGWTAFAGFCFIGPEVVLSFTTWRLCVVVGTVTKKEDGSYYRDLD